MSPLNLEKATQAPGEHEPAKVSSGELLAGRRQLIIRHGSEEYRLRLTSSNKPRQKGIISIAVTKQLHFLLPF